MSKLCLQRKHKKYRPHPHHKAAPVPVEEIEPEPVPERLHLEELVEAPVDDWTQLHRNIGIMSNNVPVVGKP